MRVLHANGHSFERNFGVDALFGKHSIQEFAIVAAGDEAYRSLAWILCWRESKTISAQERRSFLGIVFRVFS